MLILCDFDGTITVEDFTNMVWDRYIWPDWRERLLPPYREGKSTAFDLMAAGYREISASADEMLDAVGNDVSLRDGFESFMQSCNQKEWPLHVVSCGLDWYIRALLPAGVPYHCYTAEHNGRWEVKLPADVTLTPTCDFKIVIMQRLLKQHGPRETVFIGDGRNDFPIAKACQRVFAVEGSTLQHMCEDAGVRCTSI
jgi:2-hydroxy-3-keto-5-methylthiopentenyl-1-phosphate phosphatase